MKKLFLLLLFIFPLLVSAQTITKPPIFKAAYASLTVKQQGCNTCIMFQFQNPDYTMITDLVSFTVPNIDAAIDLTDKMLEILVIPKTGREENVQDFYNSIQLIRYGFAQKSVYVGTDKLRPFRKSEILKLRSALMQEKSKL